MFSTDRAKGGGGWLLGRWAAVTMLLIVPAVLTAQGTQQSDGDALARSIVEKADLVRFPADAFEVFVSVASTDAEGQSEEHRYRVLAKGHENSLVIATEPATERGQSLLMKSRDLWVFLPNVSQPVRLSLAQRLTGQVANGDLARANFSGDYDPKLLRTENIGEEPFYVLELTAVDRSVTYHRILYWVRQGNYRPFKAEFYSLSDRLLKTCLYQNYKTMAGKERPTRLVMENGLLKDEVSVVEYSTMKVRDLPDKLFTKDYLKRVE